MLAETFNEKHLKEISGCPSIRGSSLCWCEIAAVLSRVFGTW